MARDSVRWQIAVAAHRVLQDAFASADPDSGCDRAPVRLAPARPLDADRHDLAIDVYPSGHAARPAENTGIDAYTMALTLELCAPSPQLFERLYARVGNLLDAVRDGALASLIVDLRERELIAPDPVVSGSQALTRATLVFEVDFWTRRDDRFAVGP